MPLRLCEGCLRQCRAHRYNSDTMRGVCGVCRKKVRFIKTGEFTAMPERHYIRKRDPRSHTRRTRRRVSNRSRSRR
jgi:hypothetical protein